MECLNVQRLRISLTFFCNHCIINKKIQLIVVRKKGNYMKVYVYRTSGGKTLLSTLSKEVKPTVLTVLEGMQKDGVKNFCTKPIDKNITPILYEIKKKAVRIFYYMGYDNSINITYITEHKQKNKTEKKDKITAVKREKRMLKNPEIYREQI